MVLQIIAGPLLFFISKNKTHIMNRYIIIAGNSFPFKMGMTALAKFEEKAGYSITEVLAKGDKAAPKDILMLLYLGIKDGERIESKNNPNYIPTDITWEDLGDMIDEDPDGFVKAMEALAKETSAPASSAKKKK